MSDPDLRHLKAQLAAHESWAQTPNRPKRTAPARAALEQKFLDMADGDPVRAEHFRKAHYLRMAMKSVMARRKGSPAAAKAKAELARLEAEIGGQSA